MIIIDNDKCTGCGRCAADCLSKAIIIEQKARIVKNCFHCGHCVALCPQNAVRIEGCGYDMEDVEPAGAAGFGIDGKTMLHALKVRRSVRHFKAECPDRNVLSQVLEAGRFSPTGSNSQNVSYQVFTEKTAVLNTLAMKELRALEKDETAFAAVFPPPMSRDRIDFGDDDFLFKGAPAIILTLSPSAVNASIASANMELMAVSMGLGMLYVGFFTRLAEKSTALRTFLDLDATEQVVTCLALGWPDIDFLRTVPRKKAQVRWR